MPIPIARSSEDLKVREAQDDFLGKLEVRVFDFEDWALPGSDVVELQTLRTGAGTVTLIYEPVNAILMCRFANKEGGSTYLHLDELMIAMAGAAHFAHTQRESDA